MECELFEYISQSTLRMMAPLLIFDDTLICNIDPGMESQKTSSGVLINRTRRLEFGHIWD